MKNESLFKTTKYNKFKVEEEAAFLVLAKYNKESRKEGVVV